MYNLVALFLCYEMFWVLAALLIKSIQHLSHLTTLRLLFLEVNMNISSCYTCWCLKILF